MHLLIESAYDAQQYPPISLSPLAQDLYSALVDVARHVADARGYCAAVSQVHFFCPGEIVAFALGMARSTMYRKLAELGAAELVDARAHYVNHEGSTKTDGMVWCVKMHSELPGRVRVPYDALKASYRCLSADIENGRTAWKLIGQSKELQEKQADIGKILLWALPPSNSKNPVIGMTVRPDLEQILDVPFAEKENLNIAVDGAAKAMGVVLNDRGSVMFFRWLLWQMLRMDASGIDAPWYMVYEQVRRAQADSREGFARKPGALFVARLKSSPWWDELRRAPRLRVGVRPLS